MKDRLDASCPIVVVFICFCVFLDAQTQQDLAAFIATDCGNLKSLTFSHNELRGDANLTFLLESLKGRKMDEIELNDMACVSK